MTKWVFMAQAGALILVTILGGPTLLGNALCYTLLANLAVLVVVL